MIQAVTLSGFAKSFTETRPLAGDYSATLRRRAAALELFAGCSAIALVLTEANLNAFLASLGHLSPWTIKGYRGDLLTLWNAAADDGLVEFPVSRRVRRPRVPPLLVECYTLDEARRLLAEARKLTGVYPNGVALAAYWPAAIMLAWDTGFRRGDVWAFKRAALRPDNTLRIVQHKTQQIAEVQLRAATVKALDAIGTAAPLAWPLTACQFGWRFTWLVKRSGVNRGSFKWLRRASGSYVEAEQPGAGHKHLGHATAAIFSRHYDARLASGSRPMPPEL